MRVRCYRVFVDGELWDCLFVVKRGRGYELYTTVDRLPSRVSAELHRLGPRETRGPAAVDANHLERIIKALEHSDVFRRTVLRGTVADNNDGATTVGVNDVRLVGPGRPRLAYTWCELYEKTDIQYREMENVMAWLSTLGGAFSSLGDRTEHCAIVAGNISVQQLKIAMKIGDPLIAARCKLYAAISLMQRGLFKQAKYIVQSQYMFFKSQLNVDERLINMCYGIWTKLHYERNKKKMSF